jgi:hypothetical protein
MASALLKYDYTRLTPSGKPYDIHERLLEFACDIVRIAKNRIALKEAKETRFRLRVCRGTNLLDASYDPLVKESDELVRILATIVHNAIRRRKAEKAANARKRASRKRTTP